MNLWNGSKQNRIMEAKDQVTLLLTKCFSFMVPNMFAFGIKKGNFLGKEKLLFVLYTWRYCDILYFWNWTVCTAKKTCNIGLLKNLYAFTDLCLLSSFKPKLTSGIAILLFVFNLCILSKINILISLNLSHFLYFSVKQQKGSEIRTPWAYANIQIIYKKHWFIWFCFVTYKKSILLHLLFFDNWL